MPGSVKNAVSKTVFPWELSRSFARVTTIARIENVYADGASQRSRLVSTPRRRWRMVQRLTPTQAATLRAFYTARSGPLESFLFYDVYETVPRFTFDSTGAATAGRYEVRFDSRFELELSLARGDVPVELVEVN